MKFFSFLSFFHFFLGLIFRSELILLALPIGLMILFSKKISFFDIIKIGVVSAVLSLGDFFFLLTFGSFQETKYKLHFFFSVLFFSFLFIFLFFFSFFLSSFSLLFLLLFIFLFFQKLMKEERRKRSKGEKGMKSKRAKNKKN